MGSVFDQFVNVHVHELADEVKRPRAFVVDDFRQLDDVRVLPETPNRLSKRQQRSKVIEGYLMLDKVTRVKEPRLRHHRSVFLLKRSSVWGLVRI